MKGYVSEKDHTLCDLGINYKIDGGGGTFFLFMWKTLILSLSPFLYSKLLVAGQRVLQDTHPGVFESF